MRITGRQGSSSSSDRKKTELLLCAPRQAVGRVLLPCSSPPSVRNPRVLYQRPFVCCCGADPSPSPVPLSWPLKCRRDLEGGYCTYFDRKRGGRPPSPPPPGRPGWRLGVGGGGGGRGRGCNDTLELCLLATVALSAAAVCACACVYCSIRGAIYAMRCDRQLSSRYCTIDGGRRGTRPGPVPVCPGLFWAGCMTSAARGGRCPTEPSLSFSFSGGSARFAHPLTGRHLSLFVCLSCLSVWACCETSSSPRPGAMQR